jgi:hypothetical protein
MLFELCRKQSFDKSSFLKDIISKSINFIDPSTFKKYLFLQKVYQAPSFIIDTILDFMALSHFNGVNAHHSFLVCSWFTIVQNQSFAHKLFI